MLIREGRGYRNRRNNQRLLVQPPDRVQVPTQRNMHNNVFEPPPRWRMETEHKIPGTQLCCFTSNQSKKKKKVTNPAALTPNVAYCFRGPVMTILLGFLFGP